MNPLREAFRRAIMDLEGVKFAVVGGVAVGVHVEERFTRDADLAISVSNDKEAEAIVYSLRSRGWEVAELFEKLSTHRVATVRMLRSPWRESDI